MLFNLYEFIVNLWCNVFYTFGLDEILILKENVELNINNIEGEPYQVLIVGTFFDTLVQLFSFITLILIFYSLYKIIKLIISRISGW